MAKPSPCYCSIAGRGPLIASTILVSTSRLAELAPTHPAMLLIFALDWYRYVTTYGAVAPLLRNPAILACLH